MDAIGIAECPPPYSVGESLKRAMADYGRAHRKKLLDGFENRTNTTLEVKRHEKAEEDGYEVVAVEHGKDRNDYSRLFGMRVNGTERPETVFGWGVLEYEYEIADSYRQNRVTVSASAVGQMLVKAVQQLHGTCVRSVGGVYYLPDGAVDDWRKLCEAVEEPDGTQITWYEIRLNSSSMRAIGEAITNELTTASQSALNDVSSGKLGKRALENRETEMNTYRQKMREYEGILQSPLDDVRKSLEKTETAIALVKMALVSAAA
jgi:hypothetical protein